MSKSSYANKKDNIFLHSLNPLLLASLVMVQGMSPFQTTRSGCLKPLTSVWVTTWMSQVGCLTSLHVSFYHGFANTEILVFMLQLVLKNLLLLRWPLYGSDLMHNQWQLRPESSFEWAPISDWPLALFNEAENISMLHSRWHSLYEVLVF